MNVTIRPYLASDLNSVNQILQSSFSCTKGSFASEEFQEIVADIDGIVVGYLLLTRVLNPIKNHYYYLVDYVCVDSNYRGRGIGKYLLDYAYQVAKAGGGMYLQLTCSRFRIAAHKLYAKCNFMKRDSDIYRKEII